ncbi:DUF3293 domain-containing protein [Luteimonas sp. 8-5]|uniref:DUF3293 domain-containing protein n=1 Tax=Luteimonas sp. 8-5 TaxID=3039387 RepID=UPI00243631F8|nr:DUF3293 domain-containing protein [Luteimonas sp. 8-5]MDG6349289.1 DUF3293 domain-containing protein [Luteimonas sp. 8-5]
MRSLDPETLASYRSARYVVHTGADDLTLALDVPNPGLGGLMRVHGAASACLVTAYNPYSQERTPAQNEAANAELRAWLEERGWPLLEGYGSCAEEGDWDAERSFLAFGPTADDARAMCVAFNQNAVVYAGADSVPVLLFHPEINAPAAC